MSSAERKDALRQLEGKPPRCSLSTRHPDLRFAVLDAGILAA